MISLKEKTLLLAETTREQSLPTRTILRAAKDIEADLVVWGPDKQNGSPGDYPGCQVKEILLPEEVWSYQAGIFLNPGLKTLSKLAHVIIDDTRMEVLYEFLAGEQPLFFPCARENPSLVHLPAGLRRKAEEFLKEAEQMGVRIIKSPCGGTRKILKTRLITEEAVDRLAEGQGVEIRADAIITPLAQDLIRAKKIQVLRPGEGG